MITGGDLRQSRLDVGYKTFTILNTSYPVNVISFFLVLVSYRRKINTSNHLGVGFNSRDWIMKMVKFMRN